MIDGIINNGPRQTVASGTAGPFRAAYFTDGFGRRLSAREWEEESVMEQHMYQNRTQKDSA